MKLSLFDFDFSRWEIMLLFWLPACINLVIFFYSFFILEKKRITSYYSLLIFFIMHWQIADGCLCLSNSSETAEEWMKISGVAVLMVISFGLQFTLFFAEKYKGKFSRLISILLFLPSIVFSVLIIGGIQVGKIIQSESTYWAVNPEISLIALSIYIWIALGGLSMMFILWLTLRRADKNSLKQKQARLLFIGLICPIIGGIFFEIVTPIFSDFNDFPITAPLLSLFSVVSLIGIKKYGFLDYSPKRHWEKILGVMNDGILIVDKDEKIQYANKSFCELLGYTFDEIKGKDVGELFLDDAQKIELRNYVDGRKKNTTTQYEMQLKTKSGKKIWLLIRGSTFTNKNGKVIGSIGVQTNITHFKEAEKILEYNEARLKQAQEVANVGSWELDFASNKINCSDQACKMFGLSIHDKTEKSFELWMSLIHPEDISKVKNEIEKSRVNASDAFIKHRIVREDGTVRHIHSVFRYEFDHLGKPTGLFGVFHDVTEQTEAQKALIESEENMREFINESLLCIVLLDSVTKKFLFANSAFCELLGYSPEELDSMLLYDINNIAKEITDARIDDLIKNGKIKNSERQWIRKDGKIIYVMTNLFFQKRGITNVIYITALDISERKLIEDRLEDANSELKTFIYKTSHDIRGPLASILGLVNVSKNEVKNEEAMRYLEMIGNSTQKLDNTLTELVKAMEISDAQKFSDKIEFAVIAEEILNKLAHFPGYKELKITLNVTITKAFFSNKAIIETILQNLIENAIKYQNLKSKNSFLKISISEEGKFIKINVEDNGIGIDSELHDKLFDMYFRANSTVQGSGLGLYLVKRGVDKLNGEIKVSSEPNIGTTFTVMLPF